MIGKQDLAALLADATARYHAVDTDGAIAVLNRILSADPDQIEALALRALLHGKSGRLAEAVPDFEKLLRLGVGDAGTECNFGNVLVGLGRREEALACYDRALAIDTDLFQAHYNRANALRDLGRPEQALAGYDRAAALRPDIPDIDNARATALVTLGRLEEALAAYDRVLAIAPDHPYGRGTRLHIAMHLCEWRDFDAQSAAMKDQIARGIAPSNPFAVMFPSDEPEPQRRCAELHVANDFTTARLPSPRPTQSPDGRLRLGYFSGDFHNHATMHLIADQLEQHDREKFHVTAFSFGPDIRDDWRRRAVAAVDEFCDVRAETDDAIVALARAKNIDIAIDLKGFTRDGRFGIFARRAAPIQVAYLGYPGTSGADFIDYLIADAVLIPAGARDFYSEAIAYLPESYQPNCRTRAVSDQPTTRADHGLPETGFVFCSFNACHKIVPRLFALWMSILRDVPGSVLWLLADEPTARDNLRRQAKAQGVAPDRLVFAPKVAVERHLERLRLANLFLDTFPCNAHTTASEALRMGLPILTCAGRSFASRVAASLLVAVGLPDLVKSKMADYRETAVALATRPDQLMAIRVRLAANIATHPLFDSQRFTRHIEAAYLAMADRNTKNLPPSDIRIAPRASGPTEGTRRFARRVDGRG